MDCAERTSCCANLVAEKCVRIVDINANPTMRLITRVKRSMMLTLTFFFFFFFVVDVDGQQHFCASASEKEREREGTLKS